MEVLIVITIIGIMLTVSPVSRGFYNQTKYNTVIRKIVGDLRGFRLKAICDHRKYIFRIYSSDDLYKEDADFKSDYIFYYINKNGEEVVVHHGEYPGELTLYKNLREKIVQEDFYERILFTGRGTACPGTIGLRTPTGNLTRIVVSQLGRVRVEKE